MSRSSLDRALQSLMLVFLLAFAWVIVDTLQEKVVAVGDRAPHFSIVADDGRTFTRDEFGGKVLVLNFWATWCPPCIQEIPSLNEFQRRFKEQGVVVLAVSVDRNEQEYKRFLQRFPVTFQTARDPKAGLAGDYGTSKYPETYIINRDGRVVEKLINSQDWTSEEIVGRVRALL